MKQELYGSIQDLTYYFIKSKCTCIDKELKNNIYYVIKGALNNGYTYQNIINHINNTNITFESFKNLFKCKKNGSNINLLKHNDGMYYHNQLRILPPPPTSYYDPNKCEIIQEEIVYSLELRASYTINDLIEYIKTKTSMKYLANNIKKLIGAIKIEIKRFDIDYLLFLIDTADIFYCNKQKELKSLFEIEDYIKETDINFNMKKTESIINNTNKVISKIRII